MRPAGVASGEARLARPRRGSPDLRWRQYLTCDPPAAVLLGSPPVTYRPGQSSPGRVLVAVDRGRSTATGRARRARFPDTATDGYCTGARSPLRLRCRVVNPGASSTWKLRHAVPTFLRRWNRPAGGMGGAGRWPAGPDLHLVIRCCRRGRIQEAPRSAMSRTAHRQARPPSLIGVPLVIKPVAAHELSSRRLDQPRRSRRGPPSPAAAGSVHQARRLPVHIHQAATSASPGASDGTERRVDATGTSAPRPLSPGGGRRFEQAGAIPASTSTGRGPLARQAISSSLARKAGSAYPAPWQRDGAGWRPRP